MDPAQSEQSDRREWPIQAAGAPEPESCGPRAKLARDSMEASGETALVAIPVDPHVVHCQWEVAPADVEAAKRRLGVNEGEYWPALRFYEVTDSARQQAERYPSFSVDVQLGAGNWYVRSCSPEHVYRADLVLKREDGSVAVIASSEPVGTPPSSPSTCTDADWLPIRSYPRLSESAGPARLPIDMREEVQGWLAALYGARQGEVPSPALRDPSQLGGDGTEEKRNEITLPDENGERTALESALPSPSPLPIDMREEVRKLLTELYQGPNGVPHAQFGDPLFVEQFATGRFDRTSDRLEGKPDTISDLTELNERSFTMGITSRTE